MALALGLDARVLPAVTLEEHLVLEARFRGDDPLLLLVLFKESEPRLVAVGILLDAPVDDWADGQTLEGVGHLDAPGRDFDVRFARLLANLALDLALVLAVPHLRAR